MICMTVEIGESALTRRVWIAASSIERALKVAKAGKAGRRMSLVFPIDTEASCALGGSDQREAVEMECASIKRANGAISTPKEDDVTHLRHSPGVSQVPQREAPELLPGYFARISKGKLLTHEEEVELSRRAEAGDRKARRRLIKKNLRLVVSVAKRYRGMGLPFEDLIQEGNIGLMKATDRFDPEMGHRFSTYATWWIRQAVQRAVADKGRAVRLPVHTGEKARKVARVRNELSAERGREPTDEEIAESLGWTTREVSNLIGLLLDATSLDRSVGVEDGAPELGELVEDERASEAPDAVIREMENDRLRETIERMPDRERCVLVRRYGLDGQEPATLAAVGTELGVTRERVRQLQRNAERQLRERTKLALEKSSTTRVRRSSLALATGT